MKFRKSMASLLGVALLTTACSSGNSPGAGGDEGNGIEVGENFNETGMPIVNDPITLDVFIAKRPDNLADLTKVSGLLEYEEMTNIHINWEQVQADAVEERRNLAIAGGQLPDVFYGAKFSNLQIFEFAQQGTIIDLTDLIEQYAPNLTRIMEEHPEIRQAMTFPDGNIYSVPYINDPEFTEVFVDPILWVNEEWLDALGMEMPKTTDEFYEFLKAVKGQDLNGNGQNDEVPYGGHNIEALLRWLSGSFGTRNRVNEFIEQNPEQANQARFVPITEEYKEMLEYVNKLYSEGLIEQTIFSIEQNQFLANGAEEMYGSTVWYVPNNMFHLNSREAGPPFSPGLVLEGPRGDASLTLGHPVHTVGQFLITNKNENPAATIRWVDYFFSDEGSRRAFMGTEGKSYEKTADGGYKNTEWVTDNPDGLSTSEAISQHAIYRSVQGVAGLLKKEYFAGEEASPEATERAKNLERFFSSERAWPLFTFTVEENRKLAPLADDIETYVREMKAKFIAGEASFSQWDQYVKTLNDMGLEDYMEIQQAAYERYQAAAQ